MRTDTATGDSSAGKLRTALIAEGNRSEVAALQAVLRDEDVHISVVTDVRDLLSEAKRISPQVILIDTTLDGMEAKETIGILSRNPSTASAAILLVVAADADDRTLRWMNELAAFAILRRPMTCAAIRENFRAALAFVEEATKLRDASSDADKSNKRVGGCDALLKRRLLCPFHSFGVEVDYFQLRTGKVMVDSDMFDVPIYKAAVGAGDFVDYNLAGLAICRDCFFATNDPNYFENPDQGSGAMDQPGGNRNAYRIDLATRGKVASGASLRGLTAFEKLGGEPKERFFNHNRLADEALVAYELAIESSKLLYEAAPVRRSLELLRLGNYELRKAQIFEQYREDRTKASACRFAATTWLQKSFGECKGVAMYKAAYQLLALYIHLGEEGKAFRFLTTLKDQTRLSVRDQEDPATLQRYLARAQKLWGDRDMHGPGSSATPAKAA